MIRAARSALIALLLVAAPAAHAQRPAEIPPVQAVVAPHDMVVAQEARATRIGVDILKRGGNAVDAAVAVGFALAVTYPRAGNIGGGGFMLIHRAADNQQFAIDYRETAPAATTSDTFLDAKGEADPRRSRDLGPAIGVPGTVAGLALAHSKYGSGRFTLAELLEPAIALARDGFAVDTDLADSLPQAAPRFAYWPASAEIFLKRDGSPLVEGDVLKQRDLAQTLSAIARRGPRTFYEGAIAAKIAAAVQAAGGRMTAADLKSYRAVERPVVRGTYRGHTIVSMPPPSSGGALLIEMLNVLEGFTPRAGAAESLHILVETMKRAYADRAYFFGDPDFIRVPVAGLISKRYAAALRASLDPQRARPSRDIVLLRPADFEGDNTTHFSIVDRDGNAVSNTYTLNQSYGVGIVARGTGVLLNNELDDFAAKPGAPNLFGLVGFDNANAPGPRKRPLSSMTPTIVFKDNKPLIVLGAPGGSRIITAVLQVLMNVIDRGMPLADAVTAPRIHHQWLPDEVVVERGLSPAAVQALEARGHLVSVRGPVTTVNAIMATPQGLVGAADTRTRGALAAGN